MSTGTDIKPIKNTQTMPVLDGINLKELPLPLFSPYVDDIRRQYGRTVEDMANYRGGMTVEEMFALLYPATHNLGVPPTSKEKREEWLIQLEQVYCKISIGNIVHSAAMSPVELEDCRRRQEMLNKSVVSNYVPTTELRMADVQGEGNNPSYTVLQQKFVAHQYGGGVSAIWRDVPRVKVSESNKYE